jgi:hypothetical protein
MTNIWHLETWTTIHVYWIYRMEYLRRLMIWKSCELKKFLKITIFKINLKYFSSDLSDTAITNLPSTGLENLRELRVKNTPLLKRLPLLTSMPQLSSVHVHYSHHCCLFMVRSVSFINILLFFLIKKLIQTKLFPVSTKANVQKSVQKPHNPANTWKSVCIGSKEYV